MGKIVEFASSARTMGSRPASRRGAETQCEIVIFPGVRYERWESDAGSPTNPDPAPVSGRRRRGRKA